MTSHQPSLVPNDFLIEEGRVNRPPLRAWARTLLRRLESGEAGPGNWLNVSGCLNNASLIEVYRNRPRSAQALCELQLRSAENLIRFHDANAFVEFVVQPWVNLGRLLRIQGQFERALDSFAVFYDVLTGVPPRLWPLQLELPFWSKHAAAQPSMLSFVQAVYVIDSTKSYFAARDLEGAARFIQRTRERPLSASSLLLDEAEFITLFKLGRHEEAMALTDKASWQRYGVYGKLVRVTYRVAILAASGSVDAARQLGLQLAERVLKPEGMPPKDQRVLRYFQYLGQVLQAVGLPEAAARSWQAGLAATHQLEDVPLRMSFLDSLLALDAPPAREELEAERDLLLRDCQYASLLKAHGLSLDPAGNRDPVFEQLRERLEATARASAAPDSHATDDSAGAPVPNQVG